MQLVEVERPQEHRAQVGDRFLLIFRLISVPVLDAAQLGLIKARIAADPHVIVENIESRNGEVRIMVKVVKNPFPLALVIGAAATALTGLFVWLSLDKVFQIIETPTGKATALVGTVGVAVGVVGLVAAFLRRG